MSLRDAVEHLRLRAQRRCDQKHNLYWSLTDVTAVWAVDRHMRSALEDGPVEQLLSRLKR